MDLKVTTLPNDRTWSSLSGTAGLHALFYKGNARESGLRYSFVAPASELREWLVEEEEEEAQRACDERSLCVSAVCFSGFWE